MDINKCQTYINRSLKQIANQLCRTQWCKGNTRLPLVSIKCMAPLILCIAVNRIKTMTEIGDKRIETIQRTAFAVITLIPISTKNTHKYSYLYTNTCIPLSTYLFKHAICMTEINSIVKLCFYNLEPVVFNCILGFKDNALFAVWVKSTSIHNGNLLGIWLYRKYTFVSFEKQIFCLEKHIHIWH